MIDRQQIALIKVAVKQLGLDDATYRALLARVAGVDSSTKLDQRGFGLVLEELTRLGFKSTSPMKPFSARSRPGHSTNAEVWRIRKEWQAWAGEEAGFRGLDTWLQRRFGVSSLRFLDRDRTAGVLAALKAMNARRAAQHAQPAA